MTARPDWDAIRDLSRRVLREGAPLALTQDVRALLLRTADEVGIDSASEALRTDAGALTLLRECARRITDGSNRLMDALHRMFRYQDAGDYERARQEMRDVLSVEVVPYYREAAQGQLDDMADAP
ncbi:DUSAM domain-containing protein [Corallococcus exiguus]|uniref:DUSAM domain-containing protein n=1 Tax=Corallococcus TaxID=83461 RepID=UPI000EA3B810|nr:MULTISPECIES: DUSAM domain-containing protein [Corallococcus]MBN8472804.1 DUSAM domain-containing protein [Corallococcus exiguus]NNB86808.1 DUSAM domain-containing protein [Corallococcus exiguus]NNB93862.1 DUSAM domain-containing protein [Corallococcus exiguus]NNC02393.1 DUSAM domain-containing protein [Corallococcus exiguus]NNC20691.1 DUSAM domain-containing protein [Corallococcus exiguus]